MIHSADEFVRLRFSDDPEDYLRAAREPAPHEVWQTVIRDYPRMRCWVAQNKTVPLTVLEMLADDPDEDVRAAVAMKNQLTTELFAKVAADFSDSVRERVAWNRNTPSEMLTTLMSDRCSLVADAACRRLNEHRQSKAGIAAVCSPRRDLHLVGEASRSMNGRSRTCLYSGEPSSIVLA